MTYFIRCEVCGERHVATPIHVSPTQGQIYALVCPTDWLQSNYTSELLETIDGRSVR